MPFISRCPAHHAAISPLLGPRMRHARCSDDRSVSRFPCTHHHQRGSIDWRDRVIKVRHRKCRGILQLGDHDSSRCHAVVGNRRQLLEPLLLVLAFHDGPFIHPHAIGCPALCTRRSRAPPAPCPDVAGISRILCTPLHRSTPAESENAIATIGTLLLQISLRPPYPSAPAPHPQQCPPAPPVVDLRHALVDS